jgi:hypothetical protein
LAKRVNVVIPGLRRAFAAGTEFVGVLTKDGHRVTAEL